MVVSAGKSLSCSVFHTPSLGFPQVFNTSKSSIQPHESGFLEALYYPINGNRRHRQRLKTFPAKGDICKQSSFVFPLVDRTVLIRKTLNITRKQLHWPQPGTVSNCVSEIMACMCIGMVLGAIIQRRRESRDRDSLPALCQELLETSREVLKMNRELREQKREMCELQTDTIQCLKKKVEDLEAQWQRRVDVAQT
jgi:hypothetical protein